MFGHMSDSLILPTDLASSHALLREQASRLAVSAGTIAEQSTKIAEQSATIASLTSTVASQQKQLDELGLEMEKLRKLLSHFVNGSRSEKRILPHPTQACLPFDNDPEYQAARAAALAQADAIVQQFTVTRTVGKKKRDEALPSHLRRVEKVIEGDESLRTCVTHGERAIIGYDITESLVHVRPELYVIVKKYPKYACTANPVCGITSPERPTSLVEGDRFDTSIAASIIEAKWHLHLPIYRQQDIFAASGWTPSRSTLLNIVTQSAFVFLPLVNYMKYLVQRDYAVGLDETSCRLLFPKNAPSLIEGDLKSRRLADKIAEAKAKGERSLLAKMWVYRGLVQAPYNIFDFRVSRHRDGPNEFFESSRCLVQGDCFSGNLSVVIDSDERLRFVACWSHARRKFVESTTYEEECEIALAMIQALYDIETRAAGMSWQDRQALRLRESTVILRAIKDWLDTEPLRNVLPKSDFADALRYLRNHWEALNVFAHDGRIPIDNNSVEQLMKQVAMGRKAWLFVCSVASGEQSAQLMTLASSARHHDLDVWMYIKDVLDQLLAGCTDYHQLLPDVWKLKHPEAIREYRVEERRDKAERKQLNAARRRLAAQAAG
jgi:transposase